jgi:CRP/FNR family nitrogen fixation transcriptional regulator
MLVNINSASAGKQNALGQLGELSRARVVLSEFKYDRGEEIYGETEPADYIYQVVEGAVRSYKLLSDGRRQIGAFHLVGDIFGLANGPTHRFTTEAIVDTTVRLDETVQPRACGGKRRACCDRPPEYDHHQPAACRGSYAAAGAQDIA